MDALHHLRHLIAALDAALVDALCTRAQRRLNAELYALPDEPVAELPALAARFAASSTPAGRVHVLRPAYLRQILPALCEPGHDSGQPACLSADGACLDALVRRLALSVHVATRKREALPDTLQAAIRTGDPGQVEHAITNAAVEAEVLTRVLARAAERAALPATPDRIAALYASWIIPLSRKIQVHGLLATD
jgi:chorismate mutase